MHLFIVSQLVQQQEKIVDILSQLVSKSDSQSQATSTPNKKFSTTTTQLSLPIQSQPLVPPTSSAPLLSQPFSPPFSPPFSNSPPFSPTPSGLEHLEQQQSRPRHLLQPFSPYSGGHGNSHSGPHSYSTPGQFHSNSGRTSGSEAPGQFHSNSGRTSGSEAFQEKTLPSGHGNSHSGPHSYSTPGQFHSNSGRTSGSEAFQEKTLPSGQMMLIEQDYSVPIHTSMSLDSFSDDFTNWTDEDSDYLTSQSIGHSDNMHSQWYGSTSHSGARNEPSRSVTPLPQIPKRFPPPPFSTPPKLRTVEEVMANYSGSDAASLRKLTTALAREAIFGREELIKKSLTGRKDTEQLDRQKVNYIKTLVQSRVPNKSDVDFEMIWKWCRGSLSKCCQTLRNTEKKKSF